MLLFRSEENIESWCQQTNLPKGQTLPLAQVWHLSQLWYGNRLSADYTSRTTQQIKTIFQEAGLTAAFWELG